MPKYKIADICVEFSPAYEETAHWYSKYQVADSFDAEFTLEPSQESIDYFITEGVGITSGIAENMVLCNMFNRRLLKFMGSYIHSSALLYNGKVYLFSGCSGVGKSTLTKRIIKRFPEARIINDDKPSYRLIDDKCIVYGTPFAGGTDIQLNESAELGAIIFIEQGSENILTKLSTKDAISRLIEQTPRSQNFSMGDRFLSMYSQILTKYPVYGYSCKNSDDAVDAVADILENTLLTN